MNGLDWDSFRVLLAVVEAGSFSSAAQRLRISQPTAGRRIAALEEQLGTRLFVRGAKGVLLTPAGEETVAAARRMAEGADAALRRSSGHRGPTTVRISASDGIGAAWLPGRLHAIAQANPALRLELIVSNTPVDLSRRQADVSVGVFRPRDPDVVTRKAATLAFGLFASPAYLKARGEPHRVEDLAEHDVIGAPEKGPVPRYEQWLRTFVPADRFVVRSSNLLAQHEAARVGFGIVLGTIAILESDAALKRVLREAEVPSLNAWVSVHGDVRRDPAVSSVFSALVELFEREGPALGGARGT